jgi:KUP system potassium uptake protein
VSATTTGRIELSSAAPAERKKHVRFTPVSPGVDEHLLEELHELCEARESGTAFILGHSHVKMKPGSSLLKKLAKKLWGPRPKLADSKLCHC